MNFKIYYLDDEEDLCNLVDEFIASDILEVKTFTDAKEAIACCSINPPDLIFIDYRLSDTTGDEVASLLDGAIKKVLITGELHMPEHKLFEKVIPKPFKLAEIRNTIREYLNIN